MKSRHELVYFSNEPTARRMSEFVQQYLMVGERCALSPNLQYHLHTLYLDSDDWKIYWSAANGDNAHARLRVRYYDGAGDEPALFEVKKHSYDTAVRKRFKVRREAVSRILGGEFPSAEHLVDASVTGLAFGQEFVNRLNWIQARPKFHVRFSREAYLDMGEKARITFDRDICLEPAAEHSLITEMRNPHFLFRTCVVLKLKFAERFPNWYRDLVETFGDLYPEPPGVDMDYVQWGSYWLNPVDLIKCIL